MRKKSWKSCVRGMFYCRPGLNRHLLCIRSSMLEVCKILNTGLCHGGDKHKCDKNGRKGRC